jgi:TRAP-type C4-dicarboxylate transport system permease small subunit
MKVIFIIWLAFTAMTFLFAVFGSIIATRKYEKKHPHEQILRRSFVERVVAFLRSIFMCAIPIFHILLFFGYLFAWDKIIEKTIENFENEA